MAKLNTLKAAATHRVIVYGAPKTGKTELVGKLSEYFKLKWVDSENGHSTLFKLPEAWQERIELINIPDTKIYPIAAETCLKIVKGKVEICELHGKVSCMVCKREKADTITLDIHSMESDEILVFDSLTQLSNSIMSHITKNKPDDYNVEWLDYSNQGKLLEIFLSLIQQAGYNVVVISHEQETEGENKKKSLTPIGGTRNFSRTVAKYFDHVVYCERKNKKHVFASDTTYATNILTGSRTDVKMEDAEEGEASLLAIFKPEVWKAQKVSAALAQKAIPATKASANSADILARLKAKSTSNS